MGNTPKKATAKKATAKKATQTPVPPKPGEPGWDGTIPEGVRPPPPPDDQLEEKRSKIAATEDEQRRERVEQAQQAIEDLSGTVTQREWLLVCSRLDLERERIVRDGSLRLLALAWVKEKREHGGADWDRLLDMTDEELLEVHGISSEDARAQAEENPAGTPGGSS